MAARSFSLLASSVSTAGRSFSTSGAAAQLVMPPVQVYGTEGRYAAALYSAAHKQKALDAVEKDMNAFGKQLRVDPRLEDFLADPSINKGLKLDGLNGACDKMKMNALSKNVLLAVAENNRYAIIQSIISAYGNIMAAHRGEVVCEVTTAKTLDAATLKEVETTIGLFVKSGQKSLISYKVDPALIGGMVVSIGDKYVDMSTASKLKKYEEILKSAA